IKQLLQLWGQSVYAIYCGGDIFLEEGEDARDTVTVSLEEAEWDGSLCSIPYYNIYHGEAYAGTNLEYILETLVKTRLKRELAILLAANDVFDYLETSFYGNHVQMMSDSGLHYFKNYLKFGWVGDYLEYLSDIYVYDVKCDITVQTEYDFSIIIPVKNSVETLKYTLETCRKQDYEGSYEIVISDNSDYGRMEIYRYVKELDDSRIHYYKTPRNLPLTKSFEFAILKSRGKYIVPLGADDGLLPWCLSTLRSVWEQYPREDIVQWERQFYAWPGFNGSQQNQLIITRKYIKGQWDAYYQSKQDYLARVLINDNHIYSLPLLYINSAFQRNYVRTVYEATGRLWDGASQDVYIGLISVGLHDRILNIKYPLSIAGMSSTSVGARQIQLRTQDKEVYKKLHTEVSKGDNVAVYVPGVFERILPILPNDVSNLYLALMRGIERKVFPRAYMDDIFDMYSIFKKMYGRIRLDDERCDSCLHMGRFKARQISKEFGQWYEDNIYVPLINARRKVDAVVDTGKKGYIEGENTEGGITVDASRYGISNVFQAAEFIAAFVRASGEDSKSINWERTE
ncbi:MAG: glycosyltransferase family 2 protein, partial [Lachnospiraceae bacterium]|nr:glycosyltransferase family 2 protein [Lachnospiraceae bacterium]